MNHILEPNKNSLIKNIRLRISHFFISIRSFFFLGPKQKVAVALFMTIAIVGSLFYVVSFGNPFIKNDTPSNDLSFAKSPEFQRNLQKLQNLGDTVNPQNIIYTRIKFEDLPVYPEAWVKRNFSQEEMRNVLISGPEADADGDGLTNKAEYLYGSNPKNKYSLCGSSTASGPRCSLTDKENVDAGISPLTGFSLENDREIVIQRQGEGVLRTINNSFENASSEGVDFPGLYQESKLIDLENEFKEITILTNQDNRQNFLNYLKLRIEIIRSVLSDEEQANELSGLIKIYSYSKIEELEAEKVKYTDVINRLKNTQTPESFGDIHRANIIIFTKIESLIEHRIEGIKNQQTGNLQFQAISKEIATEIVWGYRRLNDENTKFERLINGN
jgi:hypothetical protein